MSLVTWILTPEEAQSVVNIVAKLPYDQVSGLIEKLVVQARNSQQQQVPQSAIPAGPINRGEIPECGSAQAGGYSNTLTEQIGDNVAQALGFNNTIPEAG